MREILFKAKRLDNGEWVEGYLINDDCGCFIMPEDYISERQLKNNHYGYELVLIKAYEVDVETICQYTGLTDKNGCKIWENDIIRTQKFTDKPHSRNFKEKAFVGVVTYKIYSTNNFNNPSISNHNYKAEWEVKLTESVGNFSYCSKSKFYDCEVIGNIFDNPELLGV